MPGPFDTSQLDSNIEAPDLYAYYEVEARVPASLHGVPDDRTTRAEAVDAAIQEAKTREVSVVIVNDDYLNYDPAAMPNGFDPTVTMLREGQRGHHVDVQAFGAAADGPGGVDDLRAINEAASWADLNGYRRVWHPPGTYTVSSDPTFPGSTEPWGEAASYDGSSTAIQAVENMIALDDGDLLKRQSGAWTPVAGVDAADVDSGTFADARIAASSVTQHEGSLSIAGSQVDSGTLPDGRIAESGVTQHEAAIDHGALLNYLASQHRTVLIDTEANRPAAGTTDRFFYATDTSRWFYDTGSTWDQLTLDAGNLTTGSIPDGRVPSSAVTQHEGSIDHNALANVSAAEHTDWTVDQGATNIADANLTSNIPRLDQNESVSGQWTFGSKLLFSDAADAANSDQAARPVIHHGTGSASAVGIDGTLHTEDV